MICLFFYQPLGASDPWVLGPCRQDQTVVVIRETKCDADSGREQKVPSKQRPDVAFIFYHFFFITLMIFFIFSQFNYSVDLINRYDCSTCNLCARYLICSGSGHQWEEKGGGGALASIVFGLLIILSQRGIVDELCVARFSFYYLIFRGGRGRLIQKLKQLSGICVPGKKEKADLWLRKALV